MSEFDFDVITDLPPRARPIRFGDLMPLMPPAPRPDPEGDRLAPEPERRPD